MYTLRSRYVPLTELSVSTRSRVTSKKRHLSVEYDKLPDTATETSHFNSVAEHMENLTEPMRIKTEEPDTVQQQQQPDIESLISVGSTLEQVRGWAEPIRIKTEKPDIESLISVGSTFGQVPIHAIHMKTDPDTVQQPDIESLISVGSTFGQVGGWAQPIRIKTEKADNESLISVGSTFGQVGGWAQPIRIKTEKTDNESLISVNSTFGQVPIHMKTDPDTVQQPDIESLITRDHHIKTEKLDIESRGSSSEGVAVKRKRMRFAEQVQQQEEPPLWREHMANIRIMRAGRNAPVDFSGAAALHDHSALPEVKRYQILVSLMLSSQTKDQVTGIAMTKLKKRGLNIENILRIPQEEVAQLIHPVGFWKKKAEYIKRTTQILADKYDGDIPNSVKGLISLPGVGPKMAHLVMDIAWGSITGIAVDTHVHRITHRLGWMTVPTTNPEVTRATLEGWLPRSEWSDLNLLLVGFGQQTCLPIGPKCAECLNRGICPAIIVKKSSPKKTSPKKASSKLTSPKKEDK